MSVTDTIAMVARGHRPPGTGLLENCRLEWAGGEAYGEEAILASFRATPLAVDSGTVLRTPNGLAWLGEDAALFADLYDGRIGRLWRTGAGTPPAAEPVVGVAFDPDMRQQRGDVLLRVEDHPDLVADAVEPLLASLRSLTDGATAAGALRARAFVVRAFSAAGGTAALCAIYRLGEGAVRSSGFGYAIISVGEGADDRVVLDQAGSGEWSPRL